MICITEVVAWPQFNYSAIVQQYGQLLNSNHIRADPFLSPPPPIRDEPTFHLRFSGLLLNRTRRALRAGFEQLAPELGHRRLSIITLDGGGSAWTVGQYRPDAAFIVSGASLTTGNNRAPGDLKVSWKWRSSMRFSQDITDRREYKQALAQVNFYGDQHNARYGFILTNTELVPLERLDSNGRLAVATPIPWTQGGSPERLSVLLGLWYLGMLAAENDSWTMGN